MSKISELMADVSIAENFIEALLCRKHIFEDALKGIDALLATEKELKKEHGFNIKAALITEKDLSPKSKKWVEETYLREHGL